jgi:Tfp pilus assembly protein FimT
MENRNPRVGTTLLELALVLSILGVLFGLAYPTLRHGLDVVAVQGARDALGSGVARTRTAAVSRGGATLMLDLRDARFWVESTSGDTVGAPVDLAARYGARLDVDGAPADRVALRFDGLGIGRVTNRTFQLRRGRAIARLTLSAYGRPRAW